jgi:hypothetical protein
MARIRTIKPEFFTSLTVCRLPVHARLTFIGLWTHVDDEGRCVDDSRLVKAAVWPLDDRTSADVEADLSLLTESSLITRYTVSERSFIAVRGWSEHQRINRPTKSKFPSPDDPNVSISRNGSESKQAGHGTKDVVLTESSLRNQGALSEDSREERNREQGKEQGTLFTPPASPRTPDKQPEPRPMTSQDVVAAYVDGAVAAGKDKPTGSLIGRVGRQAKKLLDEGIPTDKLVLAADQMGRAGWNDLAVQLQRLTHQAPARYQAYREATAPDGSRDMSKYRKPL